MAKIETTLEKMRDDYDWLEVFCYGGYGDNMEVVI